MMADDIGLGVLFEASTTGSGTGNYNSFLRIQNTGEEEGFNTDVNNQLNNKDGIWTHDLLLSSLAIVTIGPISYYEIRLDLNEVNSANGENILLEQLQMFFSASPATSSDFSGLTEVFNLADDYGDTLALQDLNSGSGTDDYKFLIPTDLFPPGATYFTLYANFSNADGGFEEFRVKSNEVGDGLPIINLVKDASVTSIDEGTPTDVTYTYTLTNTSPGADALLLTSFIDDFGTPLDDTDDVDLLDGAVDPTDSQYYVGGDTDLDGLLDKTEIWTFEFTREDTVVNAGSLTNIATVNAVDEEANNTSDSDDATVVINDVDPTINIVKTASPTQVQAGTPTLVTFTYAVTNTSPALTDEELTITSLVDDFGTPLDDTDDKDLLIVGTFVGGDADFDGFLDTGETWTYTYTTSLTLNAGEVRTNVVTVIGEDDEGTSATDNDDASVTGFNLGRTPGFWSNNGSKLWDGSDGTFPKGGSLGTNSIALPGADLAYRIYDLNGDGDTSDTVDGINEATGSRGYLMIGDWDHDGLVDPNENVIVISRADALSLLNASTKQQQDGRWMLARDVVASWLNYLGGSFVGNPDDADGDSVVHHIDQAVAWLIEATADENHIFNKADLNSDKVGTNTAPWNTGYNFNATAGVQHDVPTAPDHELGDDVNLDILGGAYLHSSLDHYNNHGFI